MRVLPIAILLTANLTAAATHAISPSAPVRFTAHDNYLLHASLSGRNYSDVPANLEIVEITVDAKAAPWRGEGNGWKPENTQTQSEAFQFRAGLLTKGRTYEARTTAPAELVLQFLPVVDKKSPSRAVQAGMSWLIHTADAWLANQPRRGAIGAEGQVQHPEARACTACHITQFSTRAYLTAVINGYSTHAAYPLDAIMQRLRDNPRPLYGHPGVNWTRVIYSARTVSSRLPVLLAMHKDAVGAETSGDRELILGAARYLLLSGECSAGSLRPEADGAKPDVSGFEIGLQSWQTFLLAAEMDPENPEWLRQAACLERIVTSLKPANVIDAAWRIVALKKMGKPVDAAIEELLPYQQPDGRFALELTKNGPPSDFISFHVLYALAMADYRGPAVERLTRYALVMQRPDGSWRGSPEYKGFDTPFRDTQFAVMALSELYPQKSGPLQSSRPRHLTQDPWRSEDRSAIQADLLARLSRDEEPAKPLIEALASTLDENLAQLREWQRTIRNPADQARLEQALRADSQRQATLLANALRTGSRKTRLHVLTAMVTVPGTDGFPARVRTGNDMEAPQILSDEGGVLQTAIAACLDPSDPELAIAAIRAGTALSDVLSPRFTAAVLRLTPQFGAVVADAYGEGRRGRLTLARTNQVDVELQGIVRGILESRHSHGLAAALPLLAALDPGHAFLREPWLVGAMEKLLRDRPEEQTLRAAAVFSDVVDGPLMRHQILAALGSPNSSVVRAAVDVMLERYLVEPRLAELTMQFLRASKGLARRMILDSLDPERLRFRLDQVSAYSPPRIPPPPDTNLFSSPIVQDFVSASLRHSDPQVQAAALDLTRKQERLRSRPAIQEALSALATSSTPRTQLLSRQVPGKQEPPIAAEDMLDFAFFRERIQPLLQSPGADGRSCAMCHATNARFPLRNDAKANFAAVARKVNLLNPVDSLILIKPLLPGVTTDGDVFRTAHNGGERWPAKTASAEYQTILEWIRGARLGASGAD